MTQETTIGANHRALALSLAATAVRNAARAGRPNPDACQMCAEDDQPIVDAMEGVARELELLANASAPDVRERLARHLFAESEYGANSDVSWDDAEWLHPLHLASADALLAVITGTKEN